MKIKEKERNLISNRESKYSNLTELERKVMLSKIADILHRRDDVFNQLDELIFNNNNHIEGKYTYTEAFSS